MASSWTNPTSLSEQGGSFASMLISILHEKEHCQILVLSGVTQGSLMVQGACMEQTISMRER